MPTNKVFPLWISAFCLLSTTALSQETVVVRWCDHLGPAATDFDLTKTISIAGEGSIVAISEFSDGSDMLGDLKELPRQCFVLVDSNSSSQFRNSTNSSKLHLLDCEGASTPQNAWTTLPRQVAASTKETKKWLI